MALLAAAKIMTPARNERMQRIKRKTRIMCVEIVDAILAGSSAVWQSKTLSFSRCRVESKRGTIRRVRHWEIILAIFAGLSASIALAEDFKTTNGKEYKNATVSRVESDGIVLSTKSGISKLYFTELSKEVQERFHYDAQKAATHSADQNTGLEQRRKQQETPLAIPSLVSSATPVPHVDFLSAPTKWAYSEHQDEMGRGATKVAQVVSSNSLHFGFPYEGETHAALQLRKSPKYGQDVMLRVDRGQFVSSRTRHFVTVRFDDGELWKFDIGEPVESTTGLLFIHDNEDFINELRKAKSLKIEADFYQEGPRVFEFEVRGLNW